jgi:primosomal protein N' (replication factor Y)
MDFFDVVFPLNIGPLTYSWPSDRGKLHPGMIVRAEVRKSLQYGIVLGNAAAKLSGPLKEIADVVLDRPLMSDSLLRLLKWMAGYYLAPEGAVLKSMAFMDYFEEAKRKRAVRPEPEGRKKYALSPELPPVSQDTIFPVRASLSRNEYGTYLLHAPTLRHEISSLLGIINGTRNIIVLVPEITHIELLLPVLTEFARDRLTVLHGRLSKGQRRNALHRILAGDSDIVLGTRIAVFAPLQAVSLLSVLQEHNQSYKNLEGVRYHARDVAVMRGYLGKSTVVLSSTAPSIESSHNTAKAKYTLLTPDGHAGRPRVEVINMKTSKKTTPSLSRRSVQAASAALKNRESVLFFINRKGYSLIECAECNTVIACPDCGIPLIYHKDKMALKCHYCAHTSRVPETCAKCRSTRLETVGAGTQRIAADLKKYLDREPLRLDSDAFRDDPELRGRAALLQGAEVIVGTKAVSGKLPVEGAYGLCVFLNPDIGLHLPDFRSSELLFQEIIAISEYVKPDGLIIIQTKMPEHHVFRFIRGYHFKEFFASELSLRKSLAYPPFSRIIVLSVTSRTDLTGEVLNALTPSDDKVETIGPLQTVKKGTSAWKVLLKSTDRERLSLYARRILAALKEIKGLRTVVDVDPISI